MYANIDDTNMLEFKIQIFHLGEIYRDAYK